MRKLFVLVTLCLGLTYLCSSAQNPAPQPSPAPATSPAPGATVPGARPGDVDSIEHIIAAVYDVISGPAGPRDWDRFRSLYYPGARLIGSSRRDGKIAARPRTVDGYIQSAGEFFKKEGFFERGIHNDVQQFDHKAQ